MGDSGVLTITGRNDGEKVMVEVSDTGVGIPRGKPAKNLRAVLYDERNRTRNRSRTRGMLWYLNGAWRHS